MTPRRVRFTATARGHVRREQTWWLEHRVHTEIFGSELEQALRIVASLPGAGTEYPFMDVPGLRRIFLRKIACHLYYTFDDHDVIVRALWGSRRERGPRLKP